MFVELRILSEALGFGVLLGFIHFGLLMATVSRLPERKHPYVFLIVGLMIRVGVVLAGLYWIGINHWERLVAALAGFTVVRLYLQYRFTKSDQKPNPIL